MEYYRDQLNELKDGEYPKSIKVFDGEGNSTKQMDLNTESIVALFEFLENQLRKVAK